MHELLQERLRRRSADVGRHQVELVVVQEDKLGGGGGAVGAPLALSSSTMASANMRFTGTYPCAEPVISLMLMSGCRPRSHR